MDLVCRGREEVVAAFVAQRDVDYEIGSIELIGGDDHVVLGALIPGLQEVDGIGVEGAIYNVFAVTDGKVTRITDYLKRNDALAAAGVDSAAREKE